MNRKDVFTKLEGLFQDFFDDEDIKLTDNTTAADIEDWDSLEHIKLIVAVEQKFRVKFSMGQVSTMKNVGEMVDIILSQLT